MYANTDDIRNLILRYPDTLVVVDCFAQWCGPCKKISPEVERLEQEYNRQIIVRKIDVDENDDFAQIAQVSAMPTFIFYKNNKEVKRVIGANMEAVHNAIRENL